MRLVSIMFYSAVSLAVGLIILVFLLRVMRRVNFLAPISSAVGNFSGLNV